MGQYWNMGFFGIFWDFLLISVSIQFLGFSGIFLGLFYQFIPESPRNVPENPRKSQKCPRKSQKVPENPRNIPESPRNIPECPRFLLWDFLGLYGTKYTTFINNVYDNIMCTHEDKIVLYEISKFNKSKPYR